MTAADRAWRTMDTAPLTATWVEVKLADGRELIAHWACGGGEEQPPFRGWFIKYRGCNGFYGIADPISWRPCRERDLRQETVADWVVRCWGEQVLQSAPERGGRLLEESLELAQAVGLPREKAQTILDYVYGRPPGEPFQEAGGVGVTLLALCASLGISADVAEATEVARVLAKPVEHFRRRHAEKEASGVMVTQQEHHR